MPQITCDRFDTKHYSDVPVVDAAAVLGEDETVTVFAVNRDLENPVSLECDFRSFEGYKVVSHSVLHHDDVKALNTEANPNEVVPCDVEPVVEDGKIMLHASSWNVIRLSK